ncbi:MAG: hypothetical protein Q9159_002888 [Coniocarpon cinnabarinum]
MPAFVTDCSLLPQYDTYDFIKPDQFRGALRGQNVVVTGASKDSRKHLFVGIGRETALAFASVGAGVILVADSSPDLDAIQEDIRNLYETPVIAISTNLAEPLSAERVIAETEDALGPVDVLVNIAVLESSFRGPLMMTKAVLEGMLERHQGTVINVTR